MTIKPHSWPYKGVSTRWPSNPISDHIRASLPSNPISDHIRASPLPYMLWVIWNMFLHTCLRHKYWEITFRSIKGSMAVFDFNSTSKETHKRHATRTLDVRYSSRCIKNVFIFKTFLDLFFFFKNRMDVIYWTHDMSFFYWFFMILYMHHYFKVKVRTRSLTLMRTLFAN